MSQKAAKNSGGADQLALIAAAKPFPKSVEIPLAGTGWKIEEAWPVKAGLQSSLKGKSLKLDLSGEFRATVLSLRRA